MSGKRFCPPVVDYSDSEKFSKIKEKLEKLIENHDDNAADFCKHIFESRLLMNDDISTNEVNGWMAIGNFQLDYSVDSERCVKNNLKEIEALTEIHVESVESNILDLCDETNECVKDKYIIVQPNKNDFPNVTVTLAMKTVEKSGSSGMPEISKLRINIQGLDFDTDLQEVIKYCQKCLEPQLFVRLMKEYLPLYHERKDLFSGLDIRYCNMRSDTVMEISNETGAVLANICLVIEFNRRLIQWDCRWVCNLTDAGKQACTAMHIPSELEATGTVNTWGWGKAIETLSKMASLDGTTPRKLDKTDFSSLNTDSYRLWYWGYY